MRSLPLPYRNSTLCPESNHCRLPNADWPLVADYGGASTVFFEVAICDLNLPPLHCKKELACRIIHGRVLPVPLLQIRRYSLSVSAKKSLINRSPTVSVQLIERRIYLIRGHRVMIESRLALRLSYSILSKARGWRRKDWVLTYRPTRYRVVLTSLRRPRQKL